MLKKISKIWIKIHDNIGTIGAYAGVIGLVSGLILWSHPKKNVTTPQQLIKPSYFSELEIKNIKDNVKKEKKLLENIKHVTSNEEAKARHYTESLPEITSEGFTIHDYSIVADLRNHRYLSPGERYDEDKKSIVTYKITQEVSNTGGDQHYRLRSSTSGKDVFNRSGAQHEGRFKEYVHKNEKYENFGERKTKVRILEFDVKNDPKANILNGEDNRFIIQIIKTFVNAFQEDKEQTWVGVHVPIETKNINLLVLFPKDRSYKNLTLTESKDGKDSPPLEKKYVYEDKYGEWVWWTITAPKIAHEYRIGWEWQ